MESGDELVKKMTRQRYWRVPMYLTLVMSGVFVTLDPSELVAQQAEHYITLAWAWGMIFSSLICLYGAFTDRWIGEYAGLPLLATVLFIYGLVAMLAANFDNLILMGIGGVMVAFAFGLGARWLDVRLVMLSARCEDLKREGE